MIEPVKKKLLHYAVMGNPVLHSFSPQLFNTIFKATGNNAHYMRIRPIDAADIVRIIHRFSLSGVNITTPYKQAVMPYLQHVSAEAQAIGGVNTIVNKDGELYGFNTDYCGVLESLAEAKCDIEGKNCLVIGAGPAASAAVFALKSKKANVFLLNRTMEKAQQIAQNLGCKVLPMDSLSKFIHSVDIVISAVLPEVNLLQSIALPSSIVILDANYRESAVGLFAQHQQCKAIHGQRWLLHQAVASYELFMGKSVDIHIMELGFKGALNSRFLRIHSLSDENLLDSDLLISDFDHFDSIRNEEINKTYGSRRSF